MQARLRGEVERRNLEYISNMFKSLDSFQMFKYQALGVDVGTSLPLNNRLRAYVCVYATSMTSNVINIEQLKKLFE